MHARRGLGWGVLRHRVQYGHSDHVELRLMRPTARTRAAAERATRHTTGATSAAPVSPVARHATAHTASFASPAASS